MQGFLDSIPTPVLVTLTIVLGVAVAYVFRKAEDKLIALRKKFSQLGKLLGQYGHVIASDVLQDAAIGDVPDIVTTVEDTLTKLLNPTTGPALLQADLISQLNSQLAMPGAAPAILKAVASFAANPANAAVVKAAGLAIVAAA